MLSVMGLKLSKNSFWNKEFVVGLSGRWYPKTQSWSMKGTWNVQLVGIFRLCRRLRELFGEFFENLSLQIVAQELQERDFAPKLVFAEVEVGKIAEDPKIYELTSSKAYFTLTGP